MPEPHSLDEWRREMQRRLGELESRMDSHAKEFAGLVERQQNQHTENTNKLAETKQSIEKMGRMLIGERGDNGLIGSVAQMKQQVQGFGDSVDEMKETIHRLPKTILTILLILTAFIGLLSFFGPSIRKAIGLDAITSPISIGRAHTQQSANSPAYTAAMQ